MAISRNDFWCFIIAICTRKAEFGPDLEDGLIANLLIFDYLHNEIGGAGYRSVDRESCSYELTQVVVEG